MSVLTKKVHSSEFIVHSSKKGFTLIELLVSVSIIAILLGFITARYQTIEKQGRDTRRKSDLAQYRLAVENYAAVNNYLYPTPFSGGACNNNAATLCNDNNFKNNFLPYCPPDPRQGASNYYAYCASGLQYTLSSLLEATNQIWEICSTGQSCLLTASSYPGSSTCSCP